MAYPGARTATGIGRAVASSSSSSVNPPPSAPPLFVSQRVLEERLLADGPPPSAPPVFVSQPVLQERLLEGRRHEQREGVNVAVLPVIEDFIKSKSRFAFVYNVTSTVAISIIAGAIGHIGFVQLSSGHIIDEVFLILLWFLHRWSWIPLGKFNLYNDLVDYLVVGYLMLQVSTNPTVLFNSLTSNVLFYCRAYYYKCTDDTLLTYVFPCALFIGLMDFTPIVNVQDNIQFNIDRELAACYNVTIATSSTAGFGPGQGVSTQVIHIDVLFWMNIVFVIIKVVWMDYNFWHLLKLAYYDYSEISIPELKQFLYKKYNSGIIGYVDPCLQIKHSYNTNLPVVPLSLNRSKKNKCCCCRLTHLGHVLLFVAESGVFLYTLISSTIQYVHLTSKCG